MALILVIFVVVVLLSIVRTIYRSRLGYNWRLGGPLELFFETFFVLLFFAGFFYLASQTILGAINSSSENVTYSQQLVSINDGTGVNGTISGGIFVVRGKIEDTQHFSYYVKEANGSYRLDKRNAQQSTIWQDATPEAARVDITDKISKCKTTWYSTWCFETPAEFVHADFHIPNNSIKEEFMLDAR